MELKVFASSMGSDFTTFMFEVSGPLVGPDLLAGTSIPYTFSFLADSQNAFGTSIVASSFDAEVPPLTGAIEGDSLNNLLAVTFNGPCNAANTHWCREVEGNGTLTFPSGIPSDHLMELGFAVEIGTTNYPATFPTIDLNATVDFNAYAVPEPRHPALVLGGVSLLFVLGRKLRTGLRQT